MNHERSLQDIIFLMLCEGKNIFYGLFLAEMNKYFADDYPTAAIGKHPDSPTLNLVLGKDFWEKTLINNSRKKGILIHEISHVMYDHISDLALGMYPDKDIANIAMDVMINQEIDEELPREDHLGNQIGVFIDQFPELNLEKGKSTLYYYNIFMEGKEEKKRTKGCKDSLVGKPGNKNGTSGSKKLDELLEGRENGSIGDWHDLWDELTKGMSDKQVELLKKELQETIKRVAEETQKLRGTVPARLESAIKDDFGRTKPVVSWKTLFNRFIGSTITTDIYQTRKRPNFRFEDSPSNKYKNKIKIIVGCDTSGSVSEHELKEFFGQIRHMWNAGVKVEVCLWDAECEEPYEYKGEYTYKRTRAGGTRASCFIEYVNKHKSKNNWTCAICLTDGFIEKDPIKCSIPMLWIITKIGSLDFVHKAPKIKIN